MIAVLESGRSVVLNRFDGVATRIPLARQVRPWALWQFKNGKTAPLDRPIPGVRPYGAWDRGLGSMVFYDR